jgi:hypothetical protein
LFQIIAAQPPNIDQILTTDGLETSFEVRFALDGDGIWRLEAF